MENKSFKFNKDNKAIESISEKKSFSKIAKSEHFSRIGPLVGNNNSASLSFYGLEKSEKEGISKYEPELALGPPWLKAIILFSGDSYDINQFFQPRIYDIGDASGKFIHFFDIGCPKQYDDNYEEIRTDSLADHDKLSIDEYKEGVDEVNSEMLYRQKEVRGFVKDNHISIDQLPCVAFTTTPLWYPFTILKIDMKWYSHPNIAKIFSEQFQEFLRGLEPEEIIIPDITNEELLKKFTIKLRDWERSLDERIGDDLLLKGSSVQGEYYCKALQHDINRYISKIGYSELIDQKSNYDLFIDGISKKFWRLQIDNTVKSKTLSYSKFEMLINMIKKGDFIEPYKIRAKDDQSYEAAYQMFKRLRSDIDIKSSGGDYEIFKHYLTEDTCKTGYKFDPPDGFTYCIILRV